MNAEAIHTYGVSFNWCICASTYPHIVRFMTPEIITHHPACSPPLLLCLSVLACGIYGNHCDSPDMENPSLGTQTCVGTQNGSGSSSIALLSATLKRHSPIVECYLVSCQAAFQNLISYYAGIVGLYYVQYLTHPTQDPFKTSRSRSSFILCIVLTACSVLAHECSRSRNRVSAVFASAAESRSSE